MTAEEVSKAQALVARIAQGETPDSNEIVETLQNLLGLFVLRQQEQARAARALERLSTIASTAKYVLEVSNTPTPAYVWADDVLDITTAAQIALENPAQLDKLEALAHVIEGGWGDPRWDGQTLRPIDRTLAQAILDAGYEPPFKIPTSVEENI